MKVEVDLVEVEDDREEADTVEVEDDQEEVEVIAVVVLTVVDIREEALVDTKEVDDQEVAHPVVTKGITQMVDQEVAHPVVTRDTIQIVDQEVDIKVDHLEKEGIKVVDLVEAREDIRVMRHEKEVIKAEVVLVVVDIRVEALVVTKVVDDLEVVHQVVDTKVGGLVDDLVETQDQLQDVTQAEALLLEVRAEETLVSLGHNSLAGSKNPLAFGEGIFC